jgi:hypothetical protein
MITFVVLAGFILALIAFDFIRILYEEGRLMLIVDLAKMATTAKKLVGADRKNGTPRQGAGKKSH